MSTAESPASLEMRKIIPASPERVFRAWTNPIEMKKWWGPKDVICVSADIELVVGGDYGIENRLPDGSILWIRGQFLAIDAPHFLSYTWIVGNDTVDTEQVSVRFEPHVSGTELLVTHSKIPTSRLREQHQRGWAGCMEGLGKYFDRLSSS